MGRKTVRPGQPLYEAAFHDTETGDTYRAYATKRDRALERLRHAAPHAHDYEIYVRLTYRAYCSECTARRPTKHIRIIHGSSYCHRCVPAYIA